MSPPVVPFRWGEWRAPMTRARSRRCATVFALGGKHQGAHHAGRAEPSLPQCPLMVVSLSTRRSASCSLDRAPVCLVDDCSTAWARWAATPFLPLLNATRRRHRDRSGAVLSRPTAPALNYGSAVDWRPTGPEAAFTSSRCMRRWALQDRSSSRRVSLTVGGAGEQHATGGRAVVGHHAARTVGGVSFDGGNGHLTGGSGGDHRPGRRSGLRRTWSTRSHRRPGARDQVPLDRARRSMRGRMSESHDLHRRERPHHPRVNRRAFDGTSPAWFRARGAPPPPDPAAAQARSEQQACSTS